MKTNEEWLDFFDEHCADIPDSILDEADTLFNIDDEYYFIYCARQYSILLENLNYGRFN